MSGTKKTESEDFFLLPEGSKSSACSHQDLSVCCHTNPLRGNRVIDSKLRTPKFFDLVASTTSLEHHIHLFSVNIYVFLKQMNVSIHLLQNNVEIKHK